MDNIKDLPGEEWQEVQGYNGKYLVSNMGRIKSLQNKEARILRAFTNNKGYPRVALSQYGQSKHYLVSRLVAAAFCDNPDPENRNTVDHIDGNKQNNTAANLRWLSLADNIRVYNEGRKANGKT